MKRSIIPALMLAIAAVAAPVFSNAQCKVVPDKPVKVGGVGPVVTKSVEMIPEPALTFIVEYYPAAGIVEMEKNTLRNTYEVELADGTELEFDSKGRVIEIDADDNNIPVDALQALLPDTAFNDLKAKNALDQVESVKLTKKGYKVELNDNADTSFIYAIDGVFMTQYNG